MGEATILYLLSPPYPQTSVSKHEDHVPDRENQDPFYGTNDRASDWIVHQQRVRTFRGLAGHAQVRYTSKLLSGWRCVRSPHPAALSTPQPKRKSAKSSPVCSSVYPEQRQAHRSTSFSIRKGHRCCCEGCAPGFQDYLGQKCHGLREVATLEQTRRLDRT